MTGDDDDPIEDDSLAARWERRRQRRFWRRRPFTAALMALAIILGIASCLNRAWRADLGQPEQTSSAVWVSADEVELRVELVNRGSAAGVVAAVNEIEGLMQQAAWLSFDTVVAAAGVGPTGSDVLLPASIAPGASAMLWVRWSVGECSTLPIDFAGPTTSAVIEPLEVTVIDRRGSEQLVLTGVSPVDELASHLNEIGACSAG